MDSDMQRFTVDELTAEGIDKLIEQNQSFQVVAVKRWKKAVEPIEARIERSGLKCRVYTEYRSAIAAASPVALLSTGILFPATVLTAASIGIHRLATWDPDYELTKNLVKRTLTVKYCR